MVPARIPTMLITGAAGAGKTTAILSLLGQRASGERWAVLVNDFGEAALHTAVAAADDRVGVREVTGCMCCTAQVSVRAALVSLLRDSAPQRLLIEASAAAVPDAICRVLAERGLADAVDLRTTLCVVDPRQLNATLYFHNAVYREQIAAANVIWLAERDTTVSERAAARAQLQILGASSILDAAAPDSVRTVLAM